MGWSCGTGASHRVDAIANACFKQTGQTNVFEVKGTKFFYDISRKEHHDGAITGSIWKDLQNGFVKKSGSFRIEGNGEFTRGPKWMKDVTAIEIQFAEEGTKYYTIGVYPENKIPTVQDLIKLKEDSEKNQRFRNGQSVEHPPITNVVAIDLQTGEIVARYDMPMFEAVI